MNLLVSWFKTTVVYRVFFGKKERNEIPPIVVALSVPPKSNVVHLSRTCPQTHTRPVVVSKRRRKQNERGAGSNPPTASPSKDKQVILTSKGLYPLLAIGEFLPSGSDRQVCCVKEILCDIWKQGAIGKVYMRFLSLRAHVIGKGFSMTEFNKCFGWLNKSGLIVEHPKAKAELLVSLRIHSENQSTRALRTAIKKGFFEMSRATKRRR